MRFAVGKKNLISQDSAQLCHILRATRAIQLTLLSLSNDKILLYFAHSFCSDLSAFLVTILSGTQNRTVERVDYNTYELEKSG